MPNDLRCVRGAAALDGANPTSEADIETRAIETIADIVALVVREHGWAVAGDVVEAGCLLAANPELRALMAPVPA